MEESKEGDQETSVFEDMFECHVSNLVEFTDKKGIP